MQRGLVDHRAARDVDDHALAAKRLGTPAFWAEGRDFGEIMEQIYRAIGDRARRLAMEPE